MVWKRRKACSKVILKFYIHKSLDTLYFKLFFHKNSFFKAHKNDRLFHSKKVLKPIALSANKIVQ